MDRPATIIGIVGYSAILDCFPLGPHLMQALQAAVVDEPNIVIENFTWSPVHIVQRFETGEMSRPARIVLVGQAALSEKAGEVYACEWLGGSQSELKVQERVYEAVTGIVDLENTLMIGEYFRVWPKECFTVEVDLPGSTFGRMVMADTQGWADDDALAAHFGYSPKAVRDQIVHAALELARNGVKTSVALRPKTAETLVPLKAFTANHFVAPETPVS